MPPFPELHDITPPTAPPLSSPEEIQRYVVLPLFGAIVLLLLIALLWRWWQARRRQAALPPLPIDPAEAARRALEALRSLADTCTPADFGREVASIVRHYLQRAHGLRAAQMTTPELIGPAGQPFGAPPLPFVRPFASVLTRCDALKFAGPALPLSERERLIDETLAALEEVRRWALTAAAPLPPPPQEQVAEPPAPAEALPPPPPPPDRGNSVSVTN